MTKAKLFIYPTGIHEIKIPLNGSPRFSLMPSTCFTTTLIPFLPPPKMSPYIGARSCRPSPPIVEWSVFYLLYSPSTIKIHWHPLLGPSSRSSMMPLASRNRDKVSWPSSTVMILMKISISYPIKMVCVKDANVFINLGLNHLPAKETYVLQSKTSNQIESEQLLHRMPVDWSLVWNVSSVSSLCINSNNVHRYDHQTTTQPHIENFELCYSYLMSRCNRMVIADLSHFLLPFSPFLRCLVAFTALF